MDLCRCCSATIDASEGCWWLEGPICTSCWTVFGHEAGTDEALDSDDLGRVMTAAERAGIATTQRRSSTRGERRGH
jgi:hypothetical protein